MSFLFGGQKQPTSEEKFAIIETELETSIDTFQRYSNARLVHRSQLTSWQDDRYL